MMSRLPSSSWARMEAENTAFKVVPSTSVFPMMFKGDGSREIARVYTMTSGVSFTVVACARAPHANGGGTLQTTARKRKRTGTLCYRDAGTDFWYFDGVYEGVQFLLDNLMVTGRSVFDVLVRTDKRKPVGKENFLDVLPVSWLAHHCVSRHREVMESEQSNDGVAGSGGWATSDGGSNGAKRRRGRPMTGRCTVKPRSTVSTHSEKMCGCKACKPDEIVPFMTKGKSRYMLPRDCYVTSTGCIAWNTGAFGVHCLTRVPRVPVKEIVRLLEEDVDFRGMLPRLEDVACIMACTKGEAYASQTKVRDWSEYGTHGVSLRWL